MFIVIMSGGAAVAHVRVTNSNIGTVDYKVNKHCNNIKCDHSHWFSVQ